MLENIVIYFHNWWSGFLNKKDANNIDFFINLLSYTRLKNFIITSDPSKANIIIENLSSNDQLLNSSQWKYKINFIGEPVISEYDKYDIVLSGVKNIKNAVDLPISVMYILGNNMFNVLNNKRTINKIPNKFCCFVVSNPKCLSRNKMFELLNNYKKVDSCGRYANNCNNNIVSLDWWSKEYINFISEYKFMICFENTKMENYSTEKIVNAYIANTAPIYWSSHEVKKIFNIDSLLFLESESDECYAKLIAKIIELDNNDEKYLEFINKQPFNSENIEYWNNNYTYEKLGEKINKLL
jgi:hypothetical protein